MGAYSLTVHRGLDDSRRACAADPAECALLAGLACPSRDSQAPRFPEVASYAFGRACDLGNGQVIQAPQTGQDVQTGPVNLASVVVATRPAALTAKP